VLINRKTIILLLAGTIILVYLPQFILGYWIRVITVIFMYGVISQGINLMSGFMGYLPLGNSMFFGIGAYVAAISMNKGIPFLFAVPLAAIIAILFSFTLGLPVLRLRGSYFAVATIGMSRAILSVVKNANEITGGAMGITLPIIDKSPRATYNYFYFSMLALMIIASIIIYLLMKSKYGFGIRSIKANEEAASSMGINTTYHKVAVWSISALFTSIAGAFYAYWMSFIGPEEVFDLMIVINAIVINLIGGLGNVLGPIVGTFIVSLLSEVSWGHFLEYHLAVLGVAIIVIVFFFPKGIIGTIGNTLKRR